VKLALFISRKIREPRRTSSSNQTAAHQCGSEFNLDGPVFSTGSKNEAASIQLLLWFGQTANLSKSLRHHSLGKKKRSLKTKMVASSLKKATAFADT
jgi:hypothetical protein